MDTELLTCTELDDVCECQHNLDTDELPAAIDALSTDQLVVLRAQCVESITRQQHIISLIEHRLESKAEPTAA